MVRTRLLRFVLQLCVSTGLVAVPFAGIAAADWFSENFEIHGFATSKMYFRSSSLNYADDVFISSWRNELNLETSLKLYDSDDFKLGLYGVLRPTYDATMDIHTHTWGNRAGGGGFGSANYIYASRLGRGIKIDSPPFGPGNGNCVDNEFCLGNADTGSLFDPDGSLTPAIIIDDNVFFGRITAPVVPRNRNNQGKIGGNATGNTYEDFLNAPLRPFGSPLAGPFGTAALANSLALASRPLGTPLNYYQGAIGNRDSLKQAPVDINRTENQLKFDFRDNAHYWGPVRELYFDMEFGNTRVRIGKQQIVWGKTDAFRLQDIVNPLDVGYHNVFPDLEERRIPQLALDVIHSFGNIGYLQDVSLEFVWNFDKFLPLQFGQCGEPYAFTAACEARADAGGHQLLNISLGRVQEREWSFKNTEPGLRLEFRIPEPSLAVSLSAYYGFQDLPVAESAYRYSSDNPNPATMLFLQGLGLGFVIESLTGTVGTSPWTTGFDPYERRNPDGSFVNSASAAAVANQLAVTAWQNLVGVYRGAGLTDRQVAGCLFDAATCPISTGLEGTQALALPWSASEFQVDYPRVLTLGGSLDYQIPGADTVVRAEVAYDINRRITNTAKANLRDNSDVFLAAIGLDRPTYIPFLNPDRTAFLSVQTFVEQVMDYDDGTGYGDGMIIPSTSIISTAFMQNYWRNDSLILTNFVAYDWNANALITGPSFRWVYNENLFFDIGINLLWGKNRKEHNIADLCPDHSLSCIGDPTTWNDGNWQQLNREFDRTARAPWWNQQSFADKFMEHRDEVWIGVTYQF